jgi:hypothetical protein
MGADLFYSTSSGPDAKTAFRDAVNEAAYECGHSGYTGTIAEKDEFVIVGTASTYDEAKAKAAAMLKADDPRVNNKWCPAGCIQYGLPTPETVIKLNKAGKPVARKKRNGRLISSFLFFGYASS